MPDTVFEWSAEMESVFNALVVRAVASDPRTDFGENVLLGMPFAVVRDDIIKKGRADFRGGYAHPTYGTLSPDEKTLLYCFTNFKKHFFACLATFSHFRASAEECLATSNPVVIDVGCGPGTACFALCDVWPGRNFAYIGVDSAQPMRDKATALWNAAQEKGLIGNSASCSLLESWDQINLNVTRRPTAIVVIFSYFCASHFLSPRELRSLAEWITKVARWSGDGTVNLAYLNSVYEIANQNYKMLKEFLGLNSDLPLLEMRISYRKKRGDPNPSNEVFLNEWLKWKGI
jgi:SAM-dependent methyltransferase